MVDGLAFLPETDVADGMQVLHGCVPDVEDADKLQSLLAYFGATYVNGGARRVQRPAAAAADDDDTVCAARRDGQKTVEETLRAVAHSPL